MTTYVIFGIAAVALLIYAIGYFREDILCILRWIAKPYRLIILIAIIGILVALIIYSDANADKSSNTKTNYKRCSFCGDRVPEYDMIGGWCEDCNENAFGEDGWYNKIKD